MEGTIMTKRFKLLSARQDMIEDIDRLFGSPFFIDFPNWFIDQLGKIETDSDFLPHDEVEYEDGTRELRIAIANYSVDDISATVEGRVLKIEGSKEQNHFRSPDDETEGDGREKVKVIRKGIATRKFVKNFFIPEDREVAEISLKDGMLYVRLPKVEKEHFRKIDIKS
jgi:HSP20 family molecular chaperone IbpA